MVGEVAGGGASPGDRRGAGVAARSLGEVGHGPAGDPPGTGASRRQFCLTDGGAGSDHARGSSDGRLAGGLRRVRAGRFSGNGYAPAWRRHAKTVSTWAGRSQQPSTPTGYGSSTVLASAKPRLLAECRSAAPQCAESWEQNHEETQKRPCAGGP